MLHRISLAWLAALALISSAPGLELGLGVMARQRAPLHYYSYPGGEGECGGRIIADFPVTQSFRLSARVGQTLASRAWSDSADLYLWGTSTLLAQLFALAAAPVGSAGTSLFGGVGAGFIGARLDEAWRLQTNAIRGDGACVALSVGARQRLTSMVSLGLELELPVYALLRVRPDGGAARYWLSQLSGYPPGLSLDILVTL